MKEFEKYLCIKDYGIFKKGNYYDFYSLYKDTYLSSSDQFDDYFIDFKEIRKLKLEKLKCI